MLERSKQALELWGAVVPYCQAPSTKQFIRWLTRFPDDFVEHAILRTGRKFSPEKYKEIPDTETIHRYVSGILLNMEKEEQLEELTDLEPVSFQAGRVTYAVAPARIAQLKANFQKRYRLHAG